MYESTSTEATSDPNSCDVKCDNDVAILTSTVLPECSWVYHLSIVSVARVGSISSAVYSPFNVFSRFGGRE